MANKDVAEVRNEDNRDGDKEAVERRSDKSPVSSDEVRASDDNGREASERSSAESGDQGDAPQTEYGKKHGLTRQQEIDLEVSRERIGEDFKTVVGVETTTKYRDAVSRFDPENYDLQEAEIWGFSDPEIEKDGHF